MVDNNECGIYFDLLSLVLLPRYPKYWVKCRIVFPTPDSWISPASRTGTAAVVRCKLTGL